MAQLSRTKTGKVSARKADQAKERKSAKASPNGNRRLIEGRETEVARLRRALKEAHEQQTSTAEVLQVINSSPGDLAPVFDAMLDRAMRLCDGAQGTLWLFDGEHMRAAATAGYSRELAAQLSEWRDIHPFQQRLLQGERVIQIADLAADELYRFGNPLTRAAVDIAGIRTVVFGICSTPILPGREG